MVPRLSHEPALQERTPPHSGATAVGAARDNARPQLKNASTCFSCFHVEEVKRSCASLPLVVQYSVSNNILTSATMGMGEAFGAMTRSDDSLGTMTCQAALIFIEENISFAKITMRSSYNLLLSICLSTIDHVVDLIIVAAKITKNSISTPSLPPSEAEALPVAAALQAYSTPRASFVCKPHTNEAPGVFPTV